MAVGNLDLPEFHVINGIQLGTSSAGIKTPGRKDLVVIELQAGTSCAGVFTKNAFCAAPVVVAKRHLNQIQPRYLVINTGNANAGTGAQGLANAESICAYLANLTGVTPEEVLPFSTGVIGEHLPVELIRQALPATLSALNPLGWAEAANGIMTTDTVPKGATASCELNGQKVVISGITKGSGMIQPNMATMLAFIATDAAIEPKLLQKLLQEANEKSFNRVTVDGDTSTNDACMLMATGQGAVLNADDAQGLASFQQALTEVMQKLAFSLVKDGEGATKFISIKVEEAANSTEALEAAFTVAHSPLVKTAFFASDANWGRILAAVGRSRGLEDLDVNRVQVYLDSVQLVENGGRAASYTEAAGSQVMQQEEIEVRILLGRGSASEQVWTCDFSHDYVSINADYRS